MVVNMCGKLGIALSSGEIQGSGEIRVLVVNGFQIATSSRGSKQGGVFGAIADGMKGARSVVRSVADKEERLALGQ
jgi:hypothetical protein